MFTSRLGKYAAAVATAALSAGAMLGMTPAAGAATTPVWSITPTPSPSGGSSLLAVSCTSASACMAVGASNTASTVTSALAERWNGTTWTALATPNPSGAYLYDVSCTSASACMAVGAYYTNDTTLTERWNGKTWAIVPSPHPGGGSYLYAVSCSSASACTAVGTYTTSTNPGLTLAERWNGTTWTKQSAPSPGGANGTRLKGVSCVSASRCVAVGVYSNNIGYSDTLAEVWNGTTWTKQSTPATGDDYPELNAVSCTSATACIAVGDYTDVADATGPIAERWNGSTWTMQSNPSDAQLYGVSCTSATACTAVGDTFNSSGAQGTLAEGWNGSTWTAQATPNPSGALTNELSGVSCPSATACLAAGDYYPPTRQNTRTLAERYS